MIFFSVINVLADQHHYQLKQYLHPSLNLEEYDPVTGWSGTQISKADALIVRTISPVNSSTIPENNKLRFVGTASAGRDHLDEKWLTEQGITVADAKGSNAVSVGEYVVTALLAACDEINVAPGELTASIIGAGFTGSATAQRLEAIGVHTLLYDPPREEREKEMNLTNPFQSVSLEESLASDILSFHVPLTRTGKYPTFQWMDSKKIRRSPKTLIINASRGGVIDESALVKAHLSGFVRHFILDVWEKEPLFNDTSLKYAFLGTPHIAGYSIEAKVKASEMMAKELHRALSLRSPSLPSKKIHQIDNTGITSSLTEILQQLHPAFSYDRALRGLSGLPPDQKRRAFLKLRQNTPLRNEFSHIRLPEIIAAQHPILKRIGFSLSADSSIP